MSGGEKKLEALSAADTLLSHAYHQGRLAGRDSLSPSLNPHPAGSAEEAEWRRGWHAEQALKGAERERETRSVKFLCRYEKRECSIACGGRGLCLDVA